MADRIHYTGEGLADADLAATPLTQAQRWIDEAIAREADRGDLTEPHTLMVGTVDDDGIPDVRPVLMRFFDARGPGFVSSLESTKARQLEANPGISGALVWLPMFRAIRFRGSAVRIPDDEVNAYWQTRPWGSRISAWASRQSHPALSRAELETVFESYAARFPDHGGSRDVPVPADWCGWRIDCQSVEFWAGRRNRLHDRFLFSRVAEGDLGYEPAWTAQRLQP